MQSWVDRRERGGRQGAGPRGARRASCWSRWFEAYVALISVHKGGPAKITSALGDETSPIRTKCEILTGANERVLDQLRAEGAVRDEVDAVQVARLVGGVATVADQADLDADSCARCSRSSPTGCC